MEINILAVPLGIGVAVFLIVKLLDGYTHQIDSFYVPTDTREHAERQAEDINENGL